MNTAEEIFNKHSFSAIGAISPSKIFCLKAMEEYSQQFKLSKELIEYIKKLVKEDIDFWDTQSRLPCSDGYATHINNKIKIANKCLTELKTLTPNG